MSVLQTWCSHWNVALLAEGVDRNQHPPKPTAENSIVALLTEGVDRNMPRGNNNYGADRRPPRGGRG